MTETIKTAEPVAWRIRPKGALGDVMGFQLISDKYAAQDYADQPAFEVQPLYTAHAQPDHLREALEECQRVFADYAEMHRHKLTHMLTEHQRKDIHRKIERNRDMSDMCLAALSRNAA